MTMSGGKQTLFGVIVITFCAMVVQKMTQKYSKETWLSHYDYVIVGGGTAGCVLANRLSANPNITVLLLEAGSDYADGAAMMDVPLAAPGNFLSPSMYWGDLSEPQSPGVSKGFKQARISHPHGKILGGSSSINMMMYARGAPEDYNDWESMGASQWSWENVEPYFKSIENAKNIPEDEALGHDGPLHITIDPPFHRINQFLLNASEELGVDISPNYNQPKYMFGSGYTQSMVHNGKRFSAVSAYIDPVKHRDNLHIVVHANVNRILFDGLRAEGVEFSRYGHVYSLYAQQEVILSAGVYNSPHILMLSGVGPAGQLKQHKIEVVADLPGVGENLHDHVAINENIFVRQETGMSISSSDASPSNIIEYLMKGTGLLAGNSFPVVTFLAANTSTWLRSTDIQNHKSPDIHIMYAPTPLGGVNPLGTFSQMYDFLNIDSDMIEKYYENGERPYGTAMVIQLTKPKGRGTVRLASSNPTDRPLINTNLMTHPQDLQTLKQGVKFIHSLTKTDTLASVGAYLLDDKYPDRERFCPEYLPYTEEHLDCYVKAMAGTSFHGVGTCKMGTDSMSVVDPWLRVNGVKSLRVVDASIMPRVVTANTQGPVMMIAERAADFILEDHEKS